MEEYICIVKLFAGNFAPRGWEICDGRLMPIARYQAVFAILGTTYGGDGVTTFALPNLLGRVSVGAGQSRGLQPYALGQVGGTEQVTLTTGDMPAHSHSLQADAANSNSNAPTGMLLATATGTTAGGDEVTINNYSNGSVNTALNPASIGIAGGGQPHENRPPYLALNYIICLDGIFPPRE